MELKKLNENDIVEISELFLEVFSSEPWNDKWESFDAVLIYIQQLIQSKNSLALGFFKDDKIIGIALGYRFDWFSGNEFFIKELCVSNKMQGQGIGSEFMFKIEEYLKEKDIKSIWLATDKSKKAFEYYKKNGFSEIENYILMGKNLK